MSEMEKAVAHIQQMQNLGSKFCTFDDTLAPEVVTQLKGIGYKVRKTQDCSGGYIDMYYEVTW